MTPRLVHPVDPPIPFDVTRELAKSCPSSIDNPLALRERVAYALAGVAARLAGRERVISRLAAGG